MKTVFYTLASIHLFIVLFAAIGAASLPRETDLSNYSGKQIISIDHNYVIGDFIYVMDVKDRKPFLVTIYQIAAKNYNIGDVIK